MYLDAGDTGGEGTGPMSTGMIFVSDDQTNIQDKFSPKGSNQFNAFQQKLKKKNTACGQGKSFS